MSARERIRQRRIVTMAEGYLELGLPLLALESLARLGDPANFSSQALYLMGDALIALGRHAEAIAPLEQAAEIAPGNLLIWLSLGWCHKRTGHVNRAVAALEEALVAEPGEAIVHYNLSCYLSLSGDKRRALAHLAKALLIDPNFRDLVDAEPDFDPIRSDAEFQALTSVIV
ncbi:MAG: tetratricopeptide repeat protein [Pirellulales bacterium]|nr:tetratricopeptide repeat protein [Pirellulales bacterium]